MHLETLPVANDKTFGRECLRILVKKSFLRKPGVVTPQCNFVSYLILQSTGDSTGEDEEELSGTCLETKHNTHHNEFLDHELIEVSLCDLPFFSTQLITVQHGRKADRPHLTENMYMYVELLVFQERIAKMFTQRRNKRYKNTGL